MKKAFTKKGMFTAEIQNILSDFNCNGYRIAPLSDGGAEIMISFDIADFINGSKGKMDVELELYENCPEALVQALIREYENMDKVYGPDVYITGKVSDNETPEERAEYMEDINIQAKDLLFSLIECIDDELCVFNVCEQYDRNEKTAGRKGLYQYLTVMGV